MARSVVDTVPAAKPLPTSKEQLQRYYLPAQPATSTVARLEAGFARIAALQHEASVALDRAKDLVLARLVDVQTAAVDGGQLDAAVRAAIDAEDDVERCRRAHDVIARAGSDLARKKMQAAIHDPEHRAWQAECKRIGNAWRDARITVPSGLTFAEREKYVERSLLGFRAEFGG